MQRNLLVVALGAALAGLSLGLVACDDDPIEVGNNAPLVRLGPDRVVSTGLETIISPERSQDFDGDSLTFAWEISARPAASTASIVVPEASSVRFTPDVDGTYQIRVTVSDGSLEATDTMTITAMNFPPVARTGPDRTVQVDFAVSLDGSASSDPEMTALTYDWQFLTVPGGSTAAFDDSSSPTPEFTPDVAGLYVIELNVTDADSFSGATQLEITAVTSLVCGISVFDLPFTDQVVGGSGASESFFITNTSGSPISGNVSEPCGPFLVLSGGGAYTLDPAEQREVVVRFSPAESEPGAQVCTIDTGNVECGTVVATGTGLVEYANVSGRLFTPGNGAGQSCESCHTTNYAWALARVNLGSPGSSALLSKPTSGSNSGHTFNSSWSVGGETYELILAWIEQGAPEFAAP